jgi:osmotically-inducible protein OsmY
MTTASNIREAVYRELNDDPMVDTDDIVVEVFKRVVLLNGTVPTQEQRTEASAAARRVAGIAEVHNLLDVALPSADFGDDKALSAIANQALTADIGVPAGVKATAQGCDVYLTGWVSHVAQRIAAEDAVAGVADVVRVINHIEIRDE